MEFKGIMPTFHKGNFPGIPSPLKMCVLSVQQWKCLINTQSAVHLRAQGRGGPTPWRQHAAAERCRTRRPPRRPRQPLARPPAASLPPAEDRRPEVAPERWQRGGGGGG